MRGQAFRYRITNDHVVLAQALASAAMDLKLEAEAITKLQSVGGRRSMALHETCLNDPF